MTPILFELLPLKENNPQENPLQIALPSLAHSDICCFCLQHSTMFVDPPKWQLLLYVNATSESQRECYFFYLTANHCVRPLALFEVAVLRTLAAGGRTVEARHALGEARAVQAGAGVAVACKRTIYGCKKICGFIIVEGIPPSPIRRATC